MKIVSFKALDADVRGYIQEDYDSLVTHRTRPAMVVCPGGGYVFCSEREEDPPAFEFLSMGYQVFILEYSTGERAGDYRPLHELGETICILRKNAAFWHIDPGRIAVMGFSAGGHLVASLGAFWNDPEKGLKKESRPDALILGYPVISTREYTHEETAETVSGGDPVIRQKLNIQDQVTGDFPPTFIWHGGKDEAVPLENSLLLAVALKKAGVPFELHIFGTGTHGISTCTYEIETPESACRAWVDLARTWLNNLFDYKP